MGKSSSKSKAPPPPPRPAHKKANDQDVTILKLKVMKDKLFNQKKNMTNHVEKAENEVREYMRKENKPAALEALRRKKLFEQYLEKANTKYFLIEQQINEVEQRIMDVNLLETLRETDKLMKDLQKSLDLDEMTDIVENLNEAQRRNQEFDKILNEYGIAATDPSINAELDRIEAEILKGQLDHIPTNAQPDTQATTSKKSDQKAVVLESEPSREREAMLA
jgi:Mg2+/Co2+ transporter CorB